jgi:predicted RNA binding protein YcfA (HicA-like mRNA interferase family)
MPRLPIISGREARKAFEKAGWIFDRQRGSHMIFGKANAPGMLSVPDHRKLDTGLLRGLIRDAGLSVDEFLKLL